MLPASTPSTAITVSAEAWHHSETVSQHLHRCIDNAEGWLCFEQFMHEALYAPGLGYYAAGSTKFSTRSQHGSQQLTGDFVTAPELTPLFGHVLAQQFQQVFSHLSEPQILEFGAGSGQLAFDILTALDASGITAQYFILEVSADLRARQAHKLAPWVTRVVWLDTLPVSFEGVVIANEVLDAMPVAMVGWSPNLDVIERGVTWHDGTFAWQNRPARSALVEALSSRMPALPNYVTEINLQAESWVRHIGQWLNKGAVFLIDYGFVESEYYHPQRQAGTLMCHIQHRAHDNPFFAPGLQDITAHVDFSAMARAAQQSGLDVMGYASQARFLLNAGLLEAAQALQVTLNTPTAPSIQAIQKLISEAEMGELFKVLALGRGLPDLMLTGFSQGDRRHQLSGAYLG
jgi:SAM-dependent MidA family methyltransferase